MVPCPQCGGEIQPTWDWCQLCGFDPDGLRPADPATTYAPPPFAAPPRPPGAPAPGPSTVYTPPSFAPPGVYTPPSFGPQPPAGAYPGPYTAYGSQPRSAPPPSNGATVLKVLGGVALAFVLLIGVCIAAVLLLGRNPTSRTSTGFGRSPNPTATPVWEPWVAPDGSFMVAFPGTPTVEDASASYPDWQRATIASVESRDRALVVIWADPGPDFYFPDPTAALDAAADRMEEGPEFTVTSREVSSFAGNPALHLHGTYHETLPFQGMVLLSGNRLYLFLAGTEPGVASGFETLRDSFRIL